MVITLFGFWKFLRMPFGLRNAEQSFQRFMDEVLRTDWIMLSASWTVSSSGASAPRSTSTTYTWSGPTVAAAVQAGVEHGEV
jgi:hypothetical protein